MAPAAAAAKLCGVGKCRKNAGGGRGIRTPGRVSPSTVFKTAALNHSAIPPLLSYLRGRHRRAAAASVLIAALRGYFFFFFLGGVGSGARSTIKIWHL